MFIGFAVIVGIGLRLGIESIGCIGFEPLSSVQSGGVVRLCHGLEVESTQVQQYVLAAFRAGAALKSDNSLIRAAGGAVALASYLTPTEESPFKNAAVAALIGLLILKSSNSLLKRRVSGKKQLLK